MEDDFPKAAAEATRRGKPLFVDAWAPWCHTCLSMRARVLADPTLGDAKLRSGKRLADAFVWASIDTERVENTSFIAAHPNRVWPTLYVLASDARTVNVAWEGSATRDELVALLSDIEAGGNDALFAVALAHAAGHRVTEARAALTTITNDTQASPGLRARSLEALVGLDDTSPDRIVALAKGALAWLPVSTSRATVLVSALSALDTLHATDEAIVLAANEGATGAPCAHAAKCPALAPDDRSGLFEALVDHAKTTGKTEDAKRLARAWQTYLAEVAAEARTADERYVYDAHRLLAAEATGEVAAFVPVLEASARTFAKDGNTHARLARAYAHLGRNDEAVREAERAVGLLEGPRVLRAASLLADLHERAGRRAEGRKALVDALHRLGDFPLTKNQRKLAEACEKRAADLRP